VKFQPAFSRIRVCVCVHRASVGSYKIIHARIVLKRSNVGSFSIIRLKGQKAYIGLAYQKAKRYEANEWVCGGGDRYKRNNFPDVTTNPRISLIERNTVRIEKNDLEIKIDFNASRALTFRRVVHSANVSRDSVSTFVWRTQNE